MTTFTVLGKFPSLLTVCFLFCFLSVFSSSSLIADIVSSDIYFGVGSQYNDVFYGDYYGRNGDIEGHAAIQGNLDADAYSFGGYWQSKHADNRNVLVVGGNADIKSSGVYDGNAYVQGQLTAKGGSYWNTISTVANGYDGYNISPATGGLQGDVYVNALGNGQSPENFGMKKLTEEQKLIYDFAASKSRLEEISADLFSKSSTVSGQNVGNDKFNVDLTGKSGLQILEIDASVLNSLNASNRQLNLLFNEGADLTLVVNITNNFGVTSVLWNDEFLFNGVEGNNNGFQDGSFDGSNVLFNFAAGIDQIHVDSAKINASLIALYSEVYITHGNIEGQVFAGSGKTTDGGEFHAYYTFNDKHFTTATPEPASMLIFGIALSGAALTGVRRRRK